ncbi:GlxA family transcriptional regulator [Pseudonocardia lacus]|uniref:GlxA family transcriptional regulator n=1 Tax=Pseudonocardia lacus TaxID=2835865 RepID=UPI001BDC89A9|nr:helix-turn-helix domain-containing protein [Pseudonocardia lacus]
MRVAVLTVDGMFDSGLSAVLDVLTAASALREDTPGAPPPFEVTVVGLTGTTRTGHGMQLSTTALADLDAPPDLVISPAVGLRTPAEVVDTVRAHPALDWLCAQAERGAAMAAACSGTFFLGEAGLLDGRRATTSWWLGPAFRARYPGVDLDERLTIAEHGNTTTAGAAFAHIDLALAIVARHSHDLAERVARHLLIGDRPSQACFAIPAQLATADPTVKAFENWVREHLDEPLQIHDVAARIGVSERALQRSTATVLGMSPIELLHEIRLDHAVHLLRTTRRSPESVALAVGYRNVSTLRALVRKRRGSTLAELTRGYRPAVRPEP